MENVKKLFLDDCLTKANEVDGVIKIHDEDSFSIILKNEQFFRYSWEEDFFQFLYSHMSLPKNMYVFSVESAKKKSFYLQFALEDKMIRLSIDPDRNSVVFSAHFRFLADDFYQFFQPYSVTFAESKELISSLFSTSKEYFSTHTIYRIKLKTGVMTFDMDSSLSRALKK